jgi:hypothetical protein
VIVELPEFSSLTVCVALLPTVTLPKLTVEGVIVSADALPVPVHCAVRSVEFVSNVSAPDSVEVEVGLNVAVIVAEFPAVIVPGADQPESVTPDPVTETLETVTLALPEFVIVKVCEAVDPTDTLPKLIEEVESFSEPETPAPFSGIVVVASSALLVIVTAPVEAPLADALNDTFIFSDCPAVSVTGAESPATVNALPETAIFEIVTDSVPSFVTVTACVEPLPTETFPKLRLAGDTVIAELPEGLLPVVPRPVVPTQPDVINAAANVTIANPLRTILPAEDFPALKGDFGATTRCVYASLITEAIVACAPVNALLYPGPQLVQVFTAGQ